MRCNHCNTILRNESNFCFGCGEPVNARDCYTHELRESAKVLTRQTDIDSVERILDLTDKIFSRTRENPNLKYEARKFFESYLPMVTDVVSRYKAVNEHESMQDQIDAVKDDLTEVLDSTEEALDIMLKELLENDIMELQINIETLKRKISRDGMMKSHFEVDE